MTIAYRASVSTGNVNLASISIVMPSGAVAGDVAILHIGRGTAEAAPTLSSGWTAIAPVDTTTSSSATHWWHVVQAGEPGSYSTSITLASSPTVGKFAARIRVYSGVDTTTPIDATNVTLVASSNASTIRTSPTVTVGTTGAMPVEFFLTKTTTAETTVTAPGSTSDVLSDLYASASSPSIFSGEDTGAYTAAGTAGGRNWTTAQAQQGVYRTVLLKPSGVTNVNGAASLANTTTLTSTGVTGTSKGATLANTVTLAATGTVTSGPSGAASLANTATLVATGTVNANSGASSSITTTLSSTGSVGSAGGFVPGGFSVAQTGAKGSSVTPSIVIPAGVLGGDVMILVITNTMLSGETITDPSGWTKLDQATNVASTLRVSVYWKYAAGTLGSASSDVGTTASATLSVSHSWNADLAVYTGINQTTAINAHTLTNDTASATTHTVGSIATSSPTYNIEGVADKGASASTAFTAPSGFTIRSQAYNTGSGSVSSAIGDSGTTPIASGTVGGDVWTGTIAPAAGAAFTLIVALNPASGANSGTATLANTVTLTAAGTAASTTPTSGSSLANTVTLSAGGTTSTGATVSYLDVGGPSSDGFIVKMKGTGFTSVSLNVSTSSSMVSPTAFGPVSADGDGFYRFAPTGLSAFTQYYYQITDSTYGVTGPICSVSTAPVPGSPTNFDVTLGACVATSTSQGQALAAATAHNPRLNIFTGDQSYVGSTSTTVSVHEGQVLNQLANVPSYSAFWRNSAKILTLSDHDAGPDNGPSNLTDAPYMRASIDAYKEYTAYRALADTRSPTVGRYYSLVYGNVKFIVIDIRNTDRTTVSVTGTSTDTMLGATQLAWLKAELITAEPFKVIVGDTQLTGPNDNMGGLPVKGDWWPAYPVERDAIFATYIPANHCGHVEYWHGDSHLIGYATNVKNSALGGVPTICAAGYAETGGGRATSSFSNFWNNSSGAVNEYGYIQFVDTGSSIRRTFTGYDASTGSDVSRVTDTVIIANSTALAATVTLSASGSVTGNATASLAETVTSSSTGTVGRVSGSSATETVTASSTGVVAITNGASLAETVTATTTGAVGQSSASSLANTVTLVSAGTVNATSGSSLAETVTATTTGFVARTTGSALANTVTLASTGTVTAGLNGGSNLSTTTTGTSAGTVATIGNSTLAVNVSTIASGVVSRSTGATLPVTVSEAATGTTGVVTGASSAIAVTLTSSGVATTTVNSAASLSTTINLAAAGFVSSQNSSTPLIETVSATATGATGKVSSGSLANSVTMSASGFAAIGAFTGNAALGQTVTLISSGFVIGGSFANINVQVSLNATGVVANASPGGWREFIGGDLIPTGLTD